MRSTKTAEILRKQGVQKMSAGERKRFEDELKQINSDLKGDVEQGEGSRPELLQQKGRMLARKRQLEDMLNKDDDLRAGSGTERDRLVARIKELEGKIKRELPTNREQERRSNMGFDFEMAVRKTVSHQKTQGANIREWQQLKRRLEPDNPMADDVGLLQRP